MLNGDGNENGKKKKSTGLISKTKTSKCSKLLCSFLCRCFARLKRETTRHVLWKKCRGSQLFAKNFDFEFLHCTKRHIFATYFARIRIGTRGVYDNILKYSRTHDVTYTQNILLRIRTVFPNSNRIAWNTMKHSNRHTSDSFSKKISIDQDHLSLEHLSMTTNF